jgi:hypothetical protein
LFRLKKLSNTFCNLLLGGAFKQGASTDESHGEDGIEGDTQIVIIAIFGQCVEDLRQSQDQVQEVLFCGRSDHRIASVEYNS